MKNEKAIEAVLCCPERIARKVYGSGRRARLESLVSLRPTLLDEKTIDAALPGLRDIDVIFSTWGMPDMTAARLDAMPNLKAIFYAAGTVKEFATLALERGVKVISAWRANGVPVAEFTLAQILLSAKGYFANSRGYVSAASFHSAPRGAGVFEQTIAILGAGAIGRLVIELLKPFRLNVVVYDPYLFDEDAAALGVRKVTLDEAFSQSEVVSNHIANIPATLGMIRGHHFASMPPNATFINTGRGQQVDEMEMIDVLKRRGDLFALLDVTYPEPPVVNSPLWSMPNVKLSSHIAGSIGSEVVRLADYVMDEFERWRDGQPLQHEVTIDMLDRMA